MPDREEWQPVVGYEGWYDVSSHGRVRRMMPARHTKPGRLLKPHPDRFGYLRVWLSTGPGRKTDYAVHQLVVIAFLGPIPDGMETDHIDRNRQNNRLDNLRYVTRHENSLNRTRSTTRWRSKYRGVVWLERWQKFRARINIFPKPGASRQLWLGTFADEEEAARAYDRAAVLHRGREAILNFPNEAA